MERPSQGDELYGLHPLIHHAVLVFVHVEPKLLKHSGRELWQRFGASNFVSPS